MLRSRLCAGVLLGLGACNAGPVSDFPFAENDGKSPVPGRPGTPDGSGVDTGNGGTQDAGTAAPNGPGGGEFGADAGTGSEPPNDADDAGPEAEDPTCPEVRAASDCRGAYCGLTRAEFDALLSSGGACVGDTATLDQVCGGGYVVNVTQCAAAELSAGRLPSEEAIAACLAGGSFRAQNPACEECFAAEASCALIACGAAFAAGDQVEAARCRAEQCGADFSACSGLPLVGP